MKNLILSIIILFLCSPVFSHCKNHEIEEKLKEQLPEYSIDSIRETPIPGIYEVVTGASIFYVSSDGKYIIDGNLLEPYKDKETNKVFYKNLTDLSAMSARVKLIDSVPKDKFFLFNSKDQTDYVTIVTDIDCPWCVKLHREINSLLEQGISVQYLVFTRDDDAKMQVISAWCSKNNTKSLTSIMNKKPINSKKCDNPIDEHQEIISSIGVGPTPAIFLSDGSLVSGYKPSNEIIEIISSKN
ncbi:MAG: DsbC family protein [Pseudomonadota bacterium]|nr:DsbC family protein [Pseudomonadota bacterium]